MFSFIKLCLLLHNMAMRWRVLCVCCIIGTPTQGGATLALYTTLNTEYLKGFLAVYCKTSNENKILRWISTNTYVVKLSINSIYIPSLFNNPVVESLAPWNYIFFLFYLMILCSTTYLCHIIQSKFLIPSCNGVGMEGFNDSEGRSYLFTYSLKSRCCF